MRRLALLCCACLACTRVNPAFDPATQASESGTETRGDPDQGSTDTTSETDSETDTDATSDTGLDDLPAQPVCEHQPSDGLVIEFVDPTVFSGNCPTGVSSSAKILSAADGEATIALCGGGGQSCDGCSGEHPLSAFPLVITEHLPQAGTCVLVESTTVLGQEPSSCFWGAVTIRDALTGRPYVIATSHSTPPTPAGAVLLAELIPNPVKGTSCNCDDVGQSNDCCYQGEAPPEFWYYPFEGADVYPGDFTPVLLGDQNADHYFELLQAQRIPTCEGQDLELSWAVVAKF